MILSTSDDNSATISSTNGAFSFFLNKLFIYLFMAALAFFSCGERGLLFVAVRRLLIAVASLVVEHGL